jgi:hypothetical protein
MPSAFEKRNFFFDVLGSNLVATLDGNWQALKRLLKKTRILAAGVCSIQKLMFFLRFFSLSGVQFFLLIGCLANKNWRELNHFPRIGLFGCPWN